MCVAGATELDTINVPILPQPFWKSGGNHNMFQSSALVSAHIESVTLPIRFSSPYILLHYSQEVIKTG